MGNASPHVWKRARSAFKMMVEHGFTPQVFVHPDGSVEIKAGGAKSPPPALPENHEQQSWEVNDDEIKRAESALSRRGATKAKS